MTHSTSAQLIFITGIAGTVLALTSCNRVSDRMEIKETREISSHSTMPKAMASSAERFFDNEEPEAKTGENPLTWATPEGWTAAPPESAATAGMRLIDLRFGENGVGECYLSAMPGQAGGLEANVNRWRTQMGLAAMTAEELTQLPKKTFLGREATFISMDGDFKSMGAQEASKGYRMLGLVQVAPEFTLFVKMTGPRDLVAKNEAAFEQFCQSISIRR